MSSIKIWGTVFKQIFTVCSSEPVGVEIFWVEPEAKFFLRNRSRKKNLEPEPGKNSSATQQSHNKYRYVSMVVEMSLYRIHHGSLQSNQ